MKHFLRSLFLPKLTLLEFHGHCCSVGKLCPAFCNCRGCVQYARLPCPSPSPRACSNSCPLSWWCHPTISSSVIPFFCLQFSPASESLIVSQLFASSGQSITASASVLPVNIQGWFPLGSTSLICCSPRDSQESSQIPQFKSINSLLLSLFYGPTLASVMTTGNTIALIIWTFVGKVMSLFWICCLGWS